MTAFSFVAAVDHLVMHRNGAPLLSPDPVLPGGPRPDPGAKTRKAARRADRHAHALAVRKELNGG